jgi:hypothetical protein
MTFCDRRWLLSLLVAAMATPAHADPTAGLWKEQTEVLVGGLSIQSVSAEVCYPASKSGANAGLVHVEKLARRLIDSSCSAVKSSDMDTTQFEVRCGGAAFGDGNANITEADAHSHRMNIIFHNHAAGIDTEYTTEGRWLGPECGSSG